jgi:hypothetical protein
LNDTPERTDAQARRDLMLSVGLLALVFVAVLAGLAHEENWRKLLRIAIASSVYVAALLSLTWASARGEAARTSQGAARASLPFWPFAVAAALAELSSGWLRPNVPAGTTLWLAPAAAFLIGGVHWLALKYWRPLRERLTGRRHQLTTR